jgi:HAD superfamily hydrolase (TIGR01509 family)
MLESKMPGGPRLKKPRGVLFDLDGVLVLTEPLKAEAHLATVRKFGGDVSPNLYHTVIGVSHEQTRSAYLVAAGLDIDPEAYSETFHENYRALLRDRLEVAPGVMRLLQRLHGEYYRLAVVSASHSWMVEQVLSQTGLAQFFGAFVSANDVVNQKPAPDAYLLALDRLSIPPIAAVVVEDSEPGMKAAVNAGMRVLAVRHSFNASHTFAAAHMILDSLLDTDLIVETIGFLLDRSHLGSPLGTTGR